MAVPLDGAGNVASGWGRASRVALAEVRDGRLCDWQVQDVGWDVLHDQGSESAHHARVARFSKQHRVGLVVTGHVGPGMRTMLERMGIAVLVGASGEARHEVLAGVKWLSAMSHPVAGS